jgi:hypothetical protein
MTRKFTMHGPRAAIALVALASSALLAGCGGSATSTGPALGALSDQTVNQDTMVGPVPVVILAATNRATDFAVGAVAADGALVPAGNIMISGTGLQRSLTLMPASDQTGSTSITVTLRDATGSIASRDFRLTVNPVYAAFTQYATTTFEADDSVAPKPVSGLTFVADADGNPSAFSALVQ